MPDLAAGIIPVDYGIRGRRYHNSITLPTLRMNFAFVALSLNSAFGSLAVEPSVGKMKMGKGSKQFFLQIQFVFERTTGSTNQTGKYNQKKAPLVLILLVCIYAGNLWLCQTTPNLFLAHRRWRKSLRCTSTPKDLQSNPYTTLSKQIISIFKKSWGDQYVTRIGGLELIKLLIQTQCSTFFTEDPLVMTKRLSLQLEDAGKWSESLAAKLTGRNMW